MLEGRIGPSLQVHEAEVVMFIFSDESTFGILFKTQKKLRKNSEKTQFKNSEKTQPKNVDSEKTQPKNVKKLKRTQKNSKKNQKKTQLQNQP